MSRFIVVDDPTANGGWHDHHVVDTSPTPAIIYVSVPWEVDAYVGSSGTAGSSRAAAVATALNANPPS